MTGKLLRSLAVVNLVDSMVEEKVLYIEAYANGREQGFCLWNMNVLENDKKVAFSENRNSDDLVLYKGTRSDFSPQGNVPSEQLYKEAKYFSFNQHYEIAKEIIDYLFS